MISLILIGEITLLTLYFYYFEIYFLMTLVFFIYYATLCMDGNEHTGFRMWGFFKRLGPTVRYTWANRQQEMKRCIFVVNGNKSYASMIGAFGINGNVFSNVCYMLPHGVFYVPILRDVLLWSGAVSDRTDLLSLLDRNWSVAVESTLDMSIFEYATTNGVTVVPVAIKGEEETFWMWNQPNWRLTQWCKSHLGWPFPFIVIPKSRKGKLRVEVGVPIEPRVYNTPESMSAAFYSMLDLKVDNGQYQEHEYRDL